MSAEGELASLAVHQYCAPDNAEYSERLREMETRVKLTAYWTRRTAFAVYRACDNIEAYMERIRREG